MEKLQVVRTEENVLLCKKCETPLRAGSYWILFCDQCNLSDDDEIVTHTMSCTHCDVPLTILYHEEKECVYGRCHNPNCGDCNSMQDLTLIPLGKTVGSKEHVVDLLGILEEQLSLGRAK